MFVHHQFALLRYRIQRAYFQVTIIPIFKIIKQNAVKNKKTAVYIVPERKPRSGTVLGFELKKKAISASLNFINKRVLGTSIGLLVYFTWTGLIGFYRIFILLFCQFPKEKAKSTCGGQKLQLYLHGTYRDYPLYVLV